MTEEEEGTSQFNLRSVFYVTFLASVFVAVFAPVFRGFRSEQSRWILGQIQVGTIATSLVHFARQRHSARQRAGAKTFGTSFKKAATFDSSRDIAPLKSLLMMVFFVLWLVYAIAIADEELLLSIFGSQIILLVFATRKFWSLVWGIDHTDIEIHELGVIHGGYQFVGWNEIAHARKSEHSKDHLAIDLKPGHQLRYCGLILRQTWIVRVIPELRDEILQRIGAKLPSPKLSD